MFFYYLESSQQNQKKSNEKCHQYTAMQELSTRNQETVNINEMTKIPEN